MVTSEMQLVSLEQTSAPASEPVTTAEAKTHSRIDTSAEDTYIGTLITAARLWVEKFTNRQLITATWVMRLDAFPKGGEIIIPKPPIQSLTSIQYIDTAGTTQTVASSTYQLNDKIEPARVKEAVNETWPSIRGGDYDSVIVTYVAGYGDNSTDVPQDILNAIKQLVAHWYEFREPVITGAIRTDIPLMVRTLLEPYRVQRFGLVA